MVKEQKNSATLLENLALYPGLSNVGPDIPEFGGWGEEQSAAEGAEESPPGSVWRLWFCKIWRVIYQLRRQRSTG